MGYKDFSFVKEERQRAKSKSEKNQRILLEHKFFFSLFCPMNEDASYFIIYCLWRYQCQRGNGVEKYHRLPAQTKTLNTGNI